MRGRSDAAWQSNIRAKKSSWIHRKVCSWLCPQVWLLIQVTHLISESDQPNPTWTANHARLYYWQRKEIKKKKKKRRVGTVNYSSFTHQDDVRVSCGAAPPPHPPPPPPPPPSPSCQLPLAVVVMLLPAAWRRRESASAAQWQRRMLREAAGVNGGDKMPSRAAKERN